MNQDSALTSEQAITQQVEAALQADQETGRYPIEVAYLNGVVSLFGQVATQEAKTAAERVARSVGGVAGVTNELTVGRGGDNGGGGGLLGGLFGRGGASDGDTGDVALPAAGVMGAQAGGVGAAGAGAGVAAPLAVAGRFADNAGGADVSRGTQAEAEADGQ